ncbi:flagellar hook-associated protein FlgK [Desulforhabdus amnigena]|jgi:flagellar hook-associated protein FlgK|uniref:Flagellar hook-associated protein 1 n=1 Tax=Desulforhabdus amnigena TaxID=40218 RepID=A0A9W6CXB1_9BACT|nr:flagellar hook-associated protein FlgK [Desulforhabdus amnigena]NLJ27635.1 flagellar hook-associated protein FlgK [Deltaproteobacteria bacterium]GLI33556.1 flagellar hook-associated protein 1 [Desulforhabdus amnigena]
MGSLNFTLEVAKNTLLNTQVSIQTTSHNIANADNAAYARQKVVMSTNPAYRFRGGWVGMGANVATVVQQRDQFVERRLVNSISEKSQSETLTSHLSLVEAYFSDDGESGISGALGSFWESWDLLHRNPTGETEKEGVAQAAKRLVEEINGAYHNLEGLAEDINGELERAVGNDGSVKSTVNALLDRIASMNAEIRLSENPGRTANDLRDQRYQAIKDLSEIIPIRYSEEQDGSLTVTLDYRNSSTDPVVLVSHDKAGELTLATDSVEGKLIEYRSFDYDSAASSGVAVTPSPGEGEISGGSLNGLIKARHVIDDSLDQLNSFADNLAEQINSLYPVFETGGSGNPAESIQVVSDLAKSMATETNNEIQNISELSLEISKMQDESISFGELGDFTFGHFLSNIHYKIGIQQSDADSKVEFYGSLVSELEAQQQSVSGVSIDEEMVDMLKNQQVYQAAAKIIQMTADLLKTVIDMV